MHTLTLTTEEYTALGLALAIATRTRHKDIKTCIGLDLAVTAGLLAQDVVRIERASAAVYGLTFPTL